MIPRNPADCVDKPKKNHYQAAHYSEEEMQELFRAVEGDPLEQPIKIAAYYGLRRSKVLGLKWEAVNFKEKTLAINHKIIEAKVDGKFVSVGEDVLKTKSSIRTLPLLPVIEDLLLQEKEKQEFMQKIFKGSYCKDYREYICVDQAGKLFRPNFVTEHFAYLIRKFGLKKICFHDLRHPYVKPMTKKYLSKAEIPDYHILLVWGLCFRVYSYAAGFGWKMLVIIWHFQYWCWFNLTNTAD